MISSRIRWSVRRRLGLGRDIGEVKGLHFPLAESGVGEGGPPFFAENLRVPKADTATGSTYAASRVPAARRPYSVFV
jgi:hypothetical protein